MWQALKKHGQRQTSFFCFSIDNSKSSLIKEEYNTRAPAARAEESGQKRGWLAQFSRVPSVLNMWRNNVQRKRNIFFLKLAHDFRALLDIGWNYFGNVRRIAFAFTRCNYFYCFQLKC